jgi:hypothetical protein
VRSAAPVRLGESVSLSFAPSRLLVYEG